MLLNANGITPR